MKKLGTLKNIQTVISAVLAIAAIILLLQKELRLFIFSSVPGTILFLTVWILLIVNFVFLLLEYRQLKTIRKDYRELYEAAYMDAVSELPNRLSCDTLLRKYMENGMPENLGCAMVDLINLPEVNAERGYEAGNALLKAFAQLLLAATPALCFAGRDSGEKFLVIFKDCAKGSPEEFLAKLEEETTRHNAMPDAVPIVYRTGVARNSTEHVNRATALAALANRRIYEQSGRD